MKLPIKIHEKAYTLGWVSKNSQVFLVLFYHPWLFDNDVTYKGCDNIMLFMWDNQKIAMAHVLDFNSSAIKKRCSFVAIANDVKELDEAIKETYSFYPIVVKWLLSFIKEEVVPKKVQNIL